MLVRVKQVVRFYKVFIIKSGVGQNKGQSVSQRILNYDWVIARMISKRYVHSTDGMEWYDFK